jgi:hypothetical protein
MDGGERGRRDGEIPALDDQLAAQPFDIGRRYRIRDRSEHENVTIFADDRTRRARVQTARHLVGIDVSPARAGLVEHLEVETAGIAVRATAVCDTDHRVSALREEVDGAHADGAEALHRDAKRTPELEDACSCLHRTRNADRRSRVRDGQWAHRETQCFVVVGDALIAVRRALRERHVP